MKEEFLCFGMDGHLYLWLLADKAGQSMEKILGVKREEEVWQQVPWVLHVKGHLV